MKINNKIFAILLIFVFAMSVSCIAAEDTSDIAENLEIADGEDDIVAVADESDNLAASEEEDALAADESEDLAKDSKATLSASADEEDASADGETISTTKGELKIEVLDKNPKVGDKVRVKITASNIGPNDANDVMVGFSFVGLDGNLDSSLKFIDDGQYDVKPVDGGYEVGFGFLGAGDSQSVTLTFVATESGKKEVDAALISDDFEDTIYESDTFTVEEASSSANGAAKEKNKIPLSVSAGNPFALLALALLCFVPYYRRR